MEKCKYQVIKKDKDGLLIYKCKLNTEPNENVFRIKEHFEEQFPGKTFCINSGIVVPACQVNKKTYVKRERNYEQKNCNLCVDIGYDFQRIF